MAAPTWQDYFDIGKAEAIVRRPDLMFEQGDISEMLTAAAAAMADRVTGWAAREFLNSYLDGASGDALRQLIDDHYNLQPHGALPAIGAVTFTRVGSPGAVTIPAGTRIATEKDATGAEAQFQTESDVSWIDGDSAPKTVYARATVANTSGNVEAGSIVRIVSSLSEAFTVTNDEPFVGGSEAESDEELRERAKKHITTIRRATLSSLAFGALQVPYVRSAAVVEGTGIDGLPNGITYVYVSDANGRSNARLGKLVSDEMVNWQSAGVIVSVEGATRYLQPIKIQLTVKTGTDVNALIQDVRDAAIAAVNGLEIGEPLYRGLVEKAVRNVSSNIVNVTIQIPDGDVTRPSNEVIRTSAALFSVS